MGLDNSCLKETETEIFTFRSHCTLAHAYTHALLGMGGRKESLTLLYGKSFPLPVELSVTSVCSRKSVMLTSVIWMGQLSQTPNIQK